MTQLNFLDAPLARTSDCATSQAAAAETLPRLRELHRRFLEAAGELQGDFTMMEAAVAANRLYPSASVETMRKRGAELARLGLIREFAIRCCGVTGRPARRFVLTPSRE